MILNKNVPCQLFEIQGVRWKRRAVGLAKNRIGTHNCIRILQRSRKDNRLYFPDEYYISGDDVRDGLASGRFEHDSQGGMNLVIIPINDLELLERGDSKHQLEPRPEPKPVEEPKKASDRFYVQINDQWKHIYLLEVYDQIDIFKQPVKMARVKLSAKSKQTHEVEFSKLQSEKPRAPRKPSEGIA